MPSSRACVEQPLDGLVIRELERRRVLDAFPAAELHRAETEQGYGHAGVAKRPQRQAHERTQGGWPMLAAGSGRFG